MTLVPQLSITAAMGLALVSLRFLIFFIHHVSGSRAGMDLPPMDLVHLIHFTAKAIEALGVVILSLGLLIAFARFARAWKHGEGAGPYRVLRQDIGRAILLGLEILVAADIIATVVADPDLRSVAVLAVIVLIRTFLSLSLEVELEGRFPWQGKGKKD